MGPGPGTACQHEAAPDRVGPWAGVAVLLWLAGCAAAPEVQTLATGRSDVSAYTLNGADLDELRREAERLCPLGGEVLRQSSQGAPQPAQADGRWRRALQTTALWLEPPLRSAQLVVQCREPGDRMRLAPALQAPPGAGAAGQPAGSAASSPATGDSATLSVVSPTVPMLPIGPVTPTW